MKKLLLSCESEYNRKVRDGGTLVLKQARDEAVLGFSGGKLNWIDGTWWQNRQARCCWEGGNAARSWFNCASDYKLRCTYLYIHRIPIFLWKNREIGAVHLWWISDGKCGAHPTDCCALFPWKHRSLKCFCNAAHQKWMHYARINI